MIAVASGDTLGNNGIELFTGLTTGFDNGATCRCHLFKIDPVANTPEEFQKFIESENVKWAKIAKETNAKPQ